MRIQKLVLPIIAAILISCQSEEHDFGDVTAIMGKYKPVIVLTGDDSLQKIAIVGAYQGRVMTSTFNGDRGVSTGWVNTDFIKKNKLVPQMNVYGGEERIWFGPEGGQYSLFFKHGEKFKEDNWQVPAAIDIDSFELIEKTDKEALFTKWIELQNYNGFIFHFRVNRKISMLTKDSLEKITNCSIGNLKYVAYGSVNTVINKDETEWRPETGLISIWIMGMYPANSTCTAVFPIQKNVASSNSVNSKYFKDLGIDRLIIKDSVAFFKMDGKYKSKIGLNHSHASNVIAGYDQKRNILTLIFYNKPHSYYPYVNSVWELQEEPYYGDVTNAYNNGVEPGKKPVLIYELETSSPALILKPQDSYTHTQQTIHLSGEPSELNKVCEKVLGVSLEQIQQAF